MSRASCSQKIRSAPICCHLRQRPGSRSAGTVHTTQTVHRLRSRPTRRIQPDVCCSFLGIKFGGNKSSEESPAKPSQTSLVETNSADDKPEVVLVETTTEDGSSARIIYRNNHTLDASAVETLCTKVGWPARPLKKVEAALQNSYLVSSLHIQVQCQGSHPKMTESLIGAARCTSDHAFNATIWDVLVDPDYQGQGLGKAMVEQMVRSLLSRGINNITLYADAKVVDFYSQLGFEADIKGIKGMFWYP